MLVHSWLLFSSEKARPVFNEENGCCSVVYFSVVCGFHTKSSMHNMYSNMIVLDGKGNCNVSYTFNESADRLEFLMQVRTTGWVGFLLLN